MSPDLPIHLEMVMKLIHYKSGSGYSSRSGNVFDLDSKPVVEFKSDTEPDWLLDLDLQPDLDKQSDPNSQPDPD
jgi:hypothetical protein